MVSPAYPGNGTVLMRHRTLTVIRLSDTKTSDRGTTSLFLQVQCHLRRVKNGDTASLSNMAANADGLVEHVTELS